MVNTSKTSMAVMTSDCNYQLTYAGVEEVHVSDEPAEIAVLRAFANTVDVEAGTDALETAESFAAWLAEQGGSMPVSAEDLERARRVRNALRHVFGDDKSSPDPAAFAVVPLRVAVPGDVPALTSVGEGVDAYLGSVLAAMVQASERGTWERLKICDAHDCRWAFYDKSKNRAGRWCSMAVCGNRTKTRTYRARHSGAGKE